MKRSIVNRAVLAIFVLAVLRVDRTVAGSSPDVTLGVLRGKSYYFGATFKLNWYKAVAFCRLQGLHLVSISNQDQLDEVIKEVGKSGYFATETQLQMWTSANDLGEQNQFVWMSTGERMVFNRWTEGEPSHGKVDDCTVEHCVALQHYSTPGGAKYSFDDRPCYTEYFFMSMFLVTIQSREQLNAVVDFIDQSGYWKSQDQLHMWTSLNDIGEEGQYFWASTGERLRFDNWRSGEPNNVNHSSCTDEDCGVLNHHPSRDIYYSFDDRPCYSTRDQPNRSIMLWRSVLLLAFLATAVYPQRNTTIGFTTWRQKSYYFSSSFELSWQKAVEHCRTRGMFLVTIQSLEDLNAVVDYIDQTGYWKAKDQLNLWTSLNDIGDEGQYVWASTGERLRFDHWRSGEPNNLSHGSCQDEDCVVLMHYPSRNIHYGFDDRPSMFLVTIQSREQLNEVVGFVNQSEYWKSADQLHMWTSLNDIGEEGQYFWASTGERLRFDQWKSGEPNNANHGSCKDEDCFKAVEHCRTRGMFLVTIQSMQELNAAWDHIDGSGYWKTKDHLNMWISLNDIGDEGQYVWASTGERLSFSHWRSGEPNNLRHGCQDEDCVVLTHYPNLNVHFSFDDRPCTDLSWRDAVQFCRRYNMYLVSINSRGQLNAIINVINKSGYWRTHDSLHMWTSLNDIRREGQHVWESTGKRLKFNNWKSGEPNNVKHGRYDEDCGVLTHHPSHSIDYKFDDRSCYDTNRNTTIGFTTSREKSYYFSNSFELSWQKAVEHCRTRGMFLVTIQSMQELNAAWDHIDGSGYWKTKDHLNMWISLNDIGDEGQYVWASTGERLSFSHWRSGEPNNLRHGCQDEDCVVLTHYPNLNVHFSFDDRPCTDVSWHKAFQVCRSQGMFLVTIENRAKLDAVIEHIEQSEDWKAEKVGYVTLWTAFNDIGQEGQFYSASTGKQLGYANWRAGEPNNFKHGDCMFENCIALLSWQKAVEYCRSVNMFLVTIQSKQKLKAVIDFIDQSGYWKAGWNGLHMWTSLNDIGEEGQHFWASTGERLRFENWRSGEPNNLRHGSYQDEDCVVLMHFPSYNITYGFDDRPCTNVELFLWMNESVKFGVLREESFYFPTKLKVSWHKAFQVCRSQGMFLVTIENRAKLDAVIEHIEQSEDWKAEKSDNHLTLWTAFNDIGQEGQFYSASTGKQLGYANWRAGEPNNVDHGSCVFENCVALVHYPSGNITYSFDDRPCNHGFTFLCEPPPETN
uniref:C-type lectin domain-containing protein n=1 Tax=Anopheles dirus TaxID=7168 RepID=A0A182NHZ5_9DIPT